MINNNNNVYSINNTSNSNLIRTINQRKRKEEVGINIKEKNNLYYNNHQKPHKIRIKIIKVVKKKKDYYNKKIHNNK